MHMKIGEAIKTAMKSKKITQTTLADMVGAKSQSVIAERLKMLFLICLMPWGMK